MKKDWIKEAYRNWFNRLDEEVPEEVWTGIADELDVDEVWDKVSEKLDRSPARSFSAWLPRVAAVLLLLFSALAAYWYLSSSPDIPKAPLANREKIPDNGREPVNNGMETTDNGSASPDNGRETPAAEQRPAAAIPPSERLVSAKDPAPARPAAPLRAAEEELVALQPAQQLQAVPAERIKQTARRFGLPELPEPETPAELLAGISTGKDAETSGDDGLPFIRLQRIGVVSAYSNTWMLNHETFSGLRPSTLTATTFTYGSGVGVNAAFLVNGKHRIGAELYLSSPAGQGYRQYIEARYQRRSIELDYSKMQLYYQLPVFSGNGDILAGAYVSYLKRGREKIAGEARTVARFYRDIDYGIMAGYQFNLPVNERLLLQPGIRVNYGLPNIFKGNQHIPGNFLRTHNAAAGIYLGVSYRLY